jgi:outer membrane lipoprotein-sorting protein
MRLLLLLPVVLLAFAEDGKEAEKLFRGAEKKLLEADTVQISFTAATTGDKLKTETKGTLLLAQDNKVRLELKRKSSLELKGKTSEKSGSDLTVCDGTRLKWERTAEGKEGKSDVKDAPKQFESMAAKASTRIGILPGFFLLRLRTAGGKVPDLEDVLKVSDFSLGKKEKVGGREARLIEYKVTPGSAAGFGATYAVQLWLDSETNLPLKRVVRIGNETTAVPTTETYDIRLNAPIDKAKFEVAKEK